MHCQYCGSKLVDNSKFCGKCGKAVSMPAFTDTQQESPVKINHDSLGEVCEVCGKSGELKYVVFYENRGAIVMRYHREIKGKLCADCINKYFWKFTLTTLLIGWLGVISLIVAPIYIINNVARYVWVKLK
jgi:hypothetical protein